MYETRTVPLLYSNPGSSRYIAAWLRWSAVEGSCLHVIGTYNTQVEAWNALHDPYLAQNTTIISRRISADDWNNMALAHRAPAALVGGRPPLPNASHIPESPIPDLPVTIPYDEARKLVAARAVFQSGEVSGVMLTPNLYAVFLYPNSPNPIPLFLHFADVDTWHLNGTRTDPLVSRLLSYCRPRLATVTMRNTLQPALWELIGAELARW